MVYRLQAVSKHLEIFYDYKTMEEFSPEWFDACSIAWRANKKRKGQSWSYVCSHDLCKRYVCAGSDMCSRHVPRGQSPRGQRFSSHSQQHEQLPLKAPLVKALAAVAVAKPSRRLETPPPSRKRQQRHTVVSPIEPTGQGVAHRVVSRRRGTLSQ